MRKIMSVTAFLLVFSLCYAPHLWGARTRSGEEKPIITIKCDAFKEIGPENSFGMMLGATETDYFDIDCGFGMQELEVEPWSVKDGAIVGTYKSVQVSEEGVIRIYGDPSKIDMIQIQGGYVTEIDMPECLNLEVLDLSHNSLKRLDLTPFTKLYAIYLSDNTFTAATPLKVGAPKNNLAILEIDIVEHLDQSFNLSDYPAMQAFDAYHNMDLWNIDPTGCPELLTLSLEMTNVSSLDVSKNPKLLSLNISETRISSIDLSHNPLITTLMAEHASGFINKGYHLKDIDLSNLSKLNILYLGGNEFTSVDLSRNPALFTLNLKNNNLTSLDLSKNPELYSVTLTGNNMDFATLPAPRETWGEYYYLQKKMPVARSIGIGETLDLSSKVLRPGTETSVAVWTFGIGTDETLVDPAMYEYADGKIKFNRALPDSVYVSYHNSLLSEYALSTTPFLIKNSWELGEPSPAIRIEPSASGNGTISAKVGMYGASPENPKTFLVDFGDGKKVEFSATSSILPETPNLSGNFKGGSTIILYVPEEEAMTAFGIEGTALQSLDLRSAFDLRILEANNTGLTDIDLRYNRCLESINLNGNDLSSLDLTGIAGNWEKNVLFSLSAANNRLSEITISQPRNLKEINLSNNLLTSMELKDYDNLLDLNLSNNQLEDEISLTYLLDAEYIDLSGNNIQRIVHDTFSNLKSLNLSDNRFTIETLPYQPGAENYIYAPQKPFELQKKMPAVNLSDQNRVLIDGKGTTFTWKKADGTPLVEGVDIICNNGATKFLNLNIGEVYCEMTNPGFPQFSGKDAYRTTNVTPVGAPTKVVASFTTLEDSANGEFIIASPVGTALYVDWRGDGSEYLAYDANRDDDYNFYEGIRTYKDAKVKIYTYDSPEDINVFSLYNIKLGDFDGTPLTNLISLALGGAALDYKKANLPEADLQEFTFSGNNLTEYIWSEKYPNLARLDLSENNLTEIDLSSLKKLKAVYLMFNNLTDVKFGNPELWQVGLNDNLLESVDLSGLKKPEEIWLGNNLLSEIDVLPFRASLRVLKLQGNRFTFATLPVPTDYPHLTLYDYRNQAKVEAEVSDDYMTFDLSSQAVVKGNDTSYTWFLGEPIYDAESGSISGETLLVDDEYTIKDGVTTFNYKFSEDVVCVLTNPLFPAGYLQTPPYRVGYDSGVSVIGDNEKIAVDVYTLSGMIVKRQVNKADALNGLPSGIYIVGGKKVFVK